MVARAGFVSPAQDSHGPSLTRRKPGDEVGDLFIVYDNNKLNKKRCQALSFTFFFRGMETFKDGNFVLVTKVPVLFKELTGCPNT